MFDSKIYHDRRERLKKQIGSGLILFLGHEESPMNYPGNDYHFRQDSSFLYFFGLDSPGLAGVIDVEENRDIIFGNDVDVEDIIWMGSQPLIKNRAVKAGVEETFPVSELGAILNSAIKKGRRVHYLPPHRPELTLKIEQLLGIGHSLSKDYSSLELIKAVVEQRSVKIQEEIEEMEIAHAITFEIYDVAMKMAKPGAYERELVGKMEGIALSYDAHMAFPTILSMDGQILHNHCHKNMLEEGRMVVCDSGVESPVHYASDITRTFPVGGRFSQKQKEIYRIVLNAQEAAIKAIKPGVKYKDIHFIAARITASGLKELGLMKGDVDEAVKAGAHAVFFPHGLGHQIGLDVHDMEGLGENFVGYDKSIKRSDQFGLAYLRLAKELQKGFVLTVEPGIYFIPALIDKWLEEKKFFEFINYEKVNEYRDFGGIRIEDDVLVTENGYRVFGKSIPKSIEDVEAVTAKA